MKKFILFVIVFSIGFCAFAQNKETVKDSNKSPKTQLMMNQFKHNWDMSIVLGTNAYFGEFTDRYKSVFEAFTIPYVDINVKKWLTPVWSIGLGVNFAKFKGIYYFSQAGFFSDLEHDKAYYGDPEHINVATGSMAGFYIKTTCDVANLFGSYREKRIFHPEIYLGGGFLVPMNKMDYRPLGITFISGIVFNFQITPHFLLGLNMEADFVSDNFEGLCPVPAVYDKNNIPFDVLQKFGVNFTYRFGFVKTKNPATGAEERHPWVPVPDATYTDQLNQALVEAKEAASKAQSELEKANAAVAGAAATDASQSAREDSLQSQIDKLKLQLMHTQDDLALAREAAVNTNTATAEKEHTKEVNFRRDTVGYWQIVTFPIDKWDITNRERVNIMAAADMIKATPGVNYVLTGYADMQTATAERNWFLSEKRANAVLKVLVEEYGIPAERLSIDFKGGVDNLYFHDVECSRSVVISPAK